LPTLFAHSGGAASEKKGSTQSREGAKARGSEQCAAGNEKLVMVGWRFYKDGSPTDFVSRFSTSNGICHFNLT
jgi:hypothetical protein